MPLCLIALGSNISATPALFQSALEQLAVRGAELVRSSQLIRTQAMGAAAGPDFLNAAATLHCRMSPQQLLQHLHDVEARSGRVRTQHWGPRTLDLDLILYGEEVLNLPELVVPHPAMWFRRFVLEPASEIAGEFTHPILRQTVSELWDALCARPLRLVLTATEPAQRVCGTLHPIADQLNSDSRNVDWQIAGSLTAGTGECFARVQLQTAEGKPRRLTQPPNPTDRSIVFYVTSADDALAQLRALSVALTG